MPHCNIIIKDEVNVKLEGLDLVTRRKLTNQFKYEIPGARFMPAVKLGRWDGTVSFFSQGGLTFVNLLDEIIPLLEQYNYTFDLDDRREHIDLQFKQIQEDTFEPPKKKSFIESFNEKKRKRNLKYIQDLRNKNKQQHFVGEGTSAASRGKLQGCH